MFFRTQKPSFSPPPPVNTVEIGKHLQNKKEYLRFQDIRFPFSQFLDNDVMLKGCYYSSTCQWVCEKCIHTLYFIYIFKYHVSCTDGKISVRINLLFYLIFPSSSHPTFVCFSCRPFVLSPSQETEITSTPSRPVENVVLTTKGLQERNTQMLDGTTVEK